ncbi:ATP adenylyltransferase [Synechococcus sp. UW140]|uniref:ATP adenylyltransferase n=1 Tax=Synechococcus sp. UW140 TaxID=368503 RepID=UPI000E0E7966|nr:ATP adenylyltransferase [Synechococcus sp. UW140]
MAIESYEQLALDRSQTALEQGALHPLKTTVSFVPSVGSEPFELRELNSELPRHLRKQGPKPNPFLPWDPRLEVCPIGQSHALILNKYPVQLGHMLLIRKGWAAQSDWLEPNDWNAVGVVDDITTGLWFFNSGPKAGASQPHRHIQLLPRSETESRCPREGWFINLINQTKKDSPDRSLVRMATAVRRRERKHNHQGEHITTLYLDMAEELSLGSPASGQRPAAPYNILLTRDWMAMVRRNCDISHGFSINALGFAGYLLATRSAERSWLKQHSPERLLSEVVDHSVVPRLPRQ